MSITVQSITWDQIRPIWENDLWPRRDTWTIRTHAINTGKSDSDGGTTFLDSDLTDYDMDIYTNYTPQYYGVFDTDGTTLIGVNSGNQVDATRWRSRGIWVHPNHRRSGIGAALLNKVIADAQAASGVGLIFSFPRVSALDVYTHVGYTKRGNDFNWPGLNYDSDQGQHCYVEKHV
jgi:GNAT superfamily N-acetyltransferase